MDAPLVYQLWRQLHRWVAMCGMDKRWKHLSTKPTSRWVFHWGSLKITTSIGYRWKCSNVWSRVVLITRKLPFFFFLREKEVYKIGYESGINRSRTYELVIESIRLVVFTSVNVTLTTSGLSQKTNDFRIIQILFNQQTRSLYLRMTLCLAVSLTQLVDRSLKKRITQSRDILHGCPLASITNSLVVIAGRITSYHSEQRS